MHNNNNNNRPPEDLVVVAQVWLCGFYWNFYHCVFSIEFDVFKQAYSIFNLFTIFLVTQMDLQNPK